MPLLLLLLLILLLLLENSGAQQGDGCGHTVLGPESGTLTSINYPQTYPNSTVCEWEIRVKLGERVRIKFGDFDIEDSDSCHFNYLRIYNGIGVSRTEIEKTQALLSLPESIFLTHQPTLEDCHQLLFTLFSTKEWQHILTGARQWLQQHAPTAAMDPENWARDATQDTMPKYNLGLQTLCTRERSYGCVGHPDHRALEEASGMFVQTTGYCGSQLATLPEGLGSHNHPNPRGRKTHLETRSQCKGPTCGDHPNEWSGIQMADELQDESLSRKICENHWVCLETMWTLNPAMLLPAESSSLDHNCEELMDEIYSSRPDLMDLPLTDPDMELFTDGSSYIQEEQRRGRHAVTTHRGHQKGTDRISEGNWLADQMAWRAAAQTEPAKGLNETAKIMLVPQRAQQLKYTKEKSQRSEEEGRIKTPDRWWKIPDHRLMIPQ
ncbi:PREDICTED: uncharacterized protein LOC103604764 [Galeopterus variegatus]|uniref:Uncharacterized protein LOC103604764 n=1 Tax=Galeopterus variegatus TaxID=482537 RepID=A0ABM0S3W3_GALVR|nr:PREDICTED: uncharacterized protein LOC103604764 [Galeopterus variegatus]